jgi:hypothetical protein
MKRLLLAIFVLSTLAASGDNPAIIRAVESSFLFEEDVRIAIRTDETGDLVSVVVKVGEESLKIGKADFGVVADPHIYSVQLTKPELDRWELSFDYELGHNVIGEFSRISLRFKTDAYLGKTLRIPTGRNRWMWKRQEHGKEEVIDGHGGVVDGVESAKESNHNGEQDGAGQPATRSELDSEGGDKPEQEAEGRSR